MKPGTQYYAGGFRLVVDSIPMRVARKPGACYAAMLKEKEKPLDFTTPAERAKDRTAQAVRAIKIYADAMGWSDKHVRVRIELQRLAVLENPMREILQEYDL